VAARGNIQGNVDNKGQEASGVRASLEDFLKGARTVLIVINDATRPTPTPSMLGVLLPEIQR